MKKFFSVVMLGTVLTFGLAQQNQQQAGQTQVGNLGQTIADVLKNNEEFEAFRVAIQPTRLAQLLASDGMYTLFAPTNDAFSMLAQEQLNTIMNDETEAQLAHHVVQGTLTIEVLRGMLQAHGGQMNLPTLGGGQLAFTLDDNGAIVVGGVAKIVAGGQIVANGVVIPISHFVALQLQGGE